jgi:hypothetical protein
MTEVFTYKAEVGSNWKLFIDAFAEFYHAPVLHQKQAVKDEADKLVRAGFEGLHYELHHPHAMISSWGGMAPPKDPNMVKPIERVLKSGLFGPWDRPDIEGLDPLPPAVNPSRHRAWGVDSFHYFVPSKTAAERLAHELAAVTFKEYGLQDANTLEATQTMLKSRVVSEFPLCDQELLLRALHKVTADYVKEHTNVVAG